MTAQAPGQPTAAQQQVRRPPQPAVSTPVPTQQKGKLTLAQATKGIIRGEPLAILAHGDAGVGKSTFGANAPKALVVGPEDGTAEIPVEGRLTPTTWEDTLAVVDQLLTEEHPYRSLVLDSADWLEPLCWAKVCAAAGKSSIESFGYGKGYQEALGEWRILLSRLQALRQMKRMNIIIIAHSVLKTFKNPDANQGDYDRYQLKLNEKAAGLLKEWAKAVLFLNYARATVEVKEGRFKGLDTGKRMIYTRMTAAYDAKNRLWLPAELPLSWHAFAQAVKDGEELRGAFADALGRVDEQTRVEMQVWIEQNNYDPAAVRSAIAQMKGAGEVQQQQQQTTKEVSK